MDVLSFALLILSGLRNINISWLLDIDFYRSVLVLNGNGADVAKHCVPAVPTKR